MNALSLLNNFEREFARPFFQPSARTPWFAEMVENNRHVFSSEMAYDEQKSAWALTVELPGVTKENVKVDIVDNHLMIKGEKTKGFNRGEFEGRYALPEGIDDQRIEALFEDGILTVSTPLSEKQSAKTIQIK